MLDERIDKPLKSSSLLDNLLMKPFTLGWTREVVNRIITKNRNLNCDIYYFSPSGKKIRSLTEIKSNLSDGLTPECFSFKRKPLGVHENYETVRDARVRKKTTEYQNKNEKCTNRNTEKLKSRKEISEGSIKERKSANLNDFYYLNEAEGEFQGNEINQCKEREVEGKKNKKIQDERDNFDINKRASVVKKKAKVELRNGKNIFKKILNVKKEKQHYGSERKTISKKIIRKRVAKSSERISSKNKKDIFSKNKIIQHSSNSSQIQSKCLSKQYQPKTKGETISNDLDEKTITRDLRSIVKKNIGKYREFREKQKLVVKNQIKNSKSGFVKKTRSEPVSKNKNLYLKPLEKGWKRELVFRVNCTKAGQQADVYYFHPDGKKLRSTREVAENLTPGLIIEYFTFRKEPIGCGEPFEVIRNARPHNRSMV